MWAVAMCYLKVKRCTFQDQADTSRLDVFDATNGSIVGFIDFTKEFKYLGSIVHYSLSSEADVDKRIKSATAFGALKRLFTNGHLDLNMKGRIYAALCLSILLYGSEVWCLKEDLFNRLRSFHPRCVRTMCRVNTAHTIRHHISSIILFTRLRIEPIDTYYHRRLL